MQQLFGKSLCTGIGDDQQPQDGAVEESNKKCIQIAVYHNAFYTECFSCIFASTLRLLKLFSFSVCWDVFKLKRPLFST